MMFKIVRSNLDKIPCFSNNVSPQGKGMWTYSSVKGLVKGYTLLKLQMTVSDRKPC